VSEAFQRLSPALQYQIVNALGFRSLRPVQEMAIDAVLAGRNCVILAPTAGGKTEAALFPLFSQMDAEDWKPVSVIYVAPLRALLNNQEERLQRYAGLIGRRAFKWHGDVLTSARRAFINDPTDLLLTTPESLEVMLMSANVPARELFRYLRAVVIDEVHAFVGDDRGGHLSALLERLSRFCGNDVQRIGLSATVGNPQDILAWAAGSSKREGTVVHPGSSAAEPKIVLDYVGSLGNAARVVASAHPGKKRLVFVDSRRGVENLGKELRDLGIETFVTHSSLSVHERQEAEEAFATRRDCVIVSTSALELGIDIGDLDHVVQIDAPTTVAGFLQRMGRTGRRPDMQSNCTFLATDDESLVQAAALLRLHDRGFVESVQLRRRAAHLLAHQIMALSLQEHGIPVSDWWNWVSPATPFQGLTEDDRVELVQHMLSAQILHDADGLLGLGPEGERRYGFRHFAELYAVFETPRVFVVMWGPQEIGTVDTYFVEAADAGPLQFSLAARSWVAHDIDWKNGILHVEPLADFADTYWQGMPVLLHYDLCQSIRQVCASADTDPSWSQRAVARMATIRADFEFLSENGLDLTPDGKAYRLWTFAGGRANLLLAKTLESVLGPKVTANNLNLGLKGDAARSEVGIRQAIRQLRDEGRPNDDDALRFAASCARTRLSKFQQCLSERLEARYLADVLTDGTGARRALRAADAIPRGT
jgi:ATP-dependent Lhr-like helicase